MGLKKRNKTSAEFSMSSLTDIIFLLLIFFMLTANFVKVEPFELPESDSKTVAPISTIISISKDGKYLVNGKIVPIRALEGAIRVDMAKGKNKDNTTIAIAAEKGTPFRKVQDVMEVAQRLRVKVILATQPKEG